VQFNALLSDIRRHAATIRWCLPREVLQSETADRYCYTDAASLLETKEHLIVSPYADRDPDDYWEEAAGRLAAMAPAVDAIQPPHRCELTQPLSPATWVNPAGAAVSTVLAGTTFRSDERS
jgi:hypothetical protein